KLHPQRLTLPEVVVEILRAGSYSSVVQIRPRGGARDSVGGAPATSGRLLSGGGRNRQSLSHPALRLAAPVAAPHRQRSLARCLFSSSERRKNARRSQPLRHCEY